MELRTPSAGLPDDLQARYEALVALALDAARSLPREEREPAFRAVLDGLEGAGREEVAA